MNQFYKNLALWLVIGLIIIGLVNVFQKPIIPQSEIIYSEFLERANKGLITEVVIQGDSISGENMDGTSFTSIAPPNDPELIKILREKGIRFSVVPGPEQPRATQAEKRGVKAYVTLRE